MKATLIIFWIYLISSCLTTPVIDYNLMEIDEEEPVPMIASLPNTIPFLPGLRYWSVNPPDFNNPLMIIAFTHWYEDQVFPSMKWAIPIISEARGRGLVQSKTKYQNSKDIYRGLLAVSALQERIRLSLVDISSQAVSVVPHHACRYWMLVSNRYTLEHYLSAVMGYSEGFRRRPTVSKKECLEFIQQIVSGVSRLEYAQFRHHLYRTETTIEQQIYDEFVQIQNDPLFSIEKVGHFIIKYSPFTVSFDGDISLPRFEDIVHFQYMPDSANSEPSHTSTSSKPNSRSQKLSQNDDVSFILKSLQGYTGFINLMLSEWLQYQENTQLIDLSKISHELENLILPWMQNIEMLLEPSIYFPEIGYSVGAAMKTLLEISTILAMVSEILPKDTLRSVTLAKFWWDFYRIILQQIYTHWALSESKDSIVNFMKESHLVAKLMNQSQFHFEILSDERTPESIIEENIMRFRQKSDISEEDVKQFAAVNGNLLELMNKANEILYGPMTEDCQQLMPSNYWFPPCQFDSSYPSENIESPHKDPHTYDFSVRIGEQDDSASDWQHCSSYPSENIESPYMEHHTYDFSDKIGEQDDSASDWQHCSSSPSESIESLDV